MSDPNHKLEVETTRGTCAIKGVCGCGGWSVFPGEGKSEVDRRSVINSMHRNHVRNSVQG